MVGLKDAGCGDIIANCRSCLLRVREGKGGEDSFGGKKGWKCIVVVVVVVVVIVVNLMIIITIIIIIIMIMINVTNDNSLGTFFFFLVSFQELSIL